MPRITYVDSVVELSANLESGYTFTTYQYKPTGGFNIGFKCIDDGLLKNINPPYTIRYKGDQSY